MGAPVVVPRITPELNRVRLAQRSVASPPSRKNQLTHDDADEDPDYQYQQSTLIHLDSLSSKTGE
jgi:hypothetical protein